MIAKDASVESNSPSLESNNEHQTTLKPQTSVKETSSKRFSRRGSEWEILEGLKDGQRFDTKPLAYSGYLHKKRKWPLKGWHKRYFVVDKGMLIYGKSPGDIARGKIHGHVDIGLSVISTKSKRRRLDIDAEEFIYHLKAKTLEQFTEWVEQLKKHRLYRQHILTFGNGSSKMAAENNKISRGKIRTIISTPSLYGLRSFISSTFQKLPMSQELAKQSGGPSPPPAPLRLANILADSNPLEQITKELLQVEQNLVQLEQIYNQLEASGAPSVTPTHNAEETNAAAGDGASPNVKKDRRRFGLHKKKNSGGSWGGGKGGCSIDLSLPAPQSLPHQSSPSKPTDAHDSSLPTVSSSSSLGVTNLCTALSTSNPSLSTLVPPKTHSFHATDTTTLPGDTQLLHSDYIILAKDVLNNFKSISYTFSTERDRLKLIVDSENTNRESSNLRNSLQHVLQQNVEIRSRLNKIHEFSDLSDVNEAKALTNSLSYSSSCLSASEVFFDAEEYLPEEDRPVVATNNQASDSSSEAGSLSSEEGSVSSENSELGATDFNHNPTSNNVILSRNMTGRRTKLPCPRPDTESLSLWNLLCKNIGKDLSQVSMPVALNEPLNMLQRMCEELEYSELLDKAAELSDPYERMVYVAAFAVSSYGSSYFRAGSKPFNPLLGESYECVREDKGFKFIAEQVSHHPPVSVCHAESKNFIFWQDVRIKTKFWGKSMEFQPNGFVNLKLLRPDSNDHYRWNKVTTCVHNLFGGQRWVDQYGELNITNLDTNITCKLTFCKASLWNPKRQEVYGTVLDSDNKVQRKLIGKWNEALYCGEAPNLKLVWRLGTMPEEYEMYYGFTRFAIELNELNTEMKRLIPITDTRLRPDQRLLEQGNLNGAEQLKLKLEQSQRERRKKNEENGILHTPHWFRRVRVQDGELWEYNGKYWEARKNNFKSINFDPLW
uniref:Oxysterol-binding protein-related protein 6 n=1 Tax=Cacopsylla melanoneura TaxID=428564 RepID=A0A8D8VD64_9HEMI